MWVKYNVLPKRFELINRLFVASGFSYFMNFFYRYKKSHKLIGIIALFFIPLSVIVGLLCILYRRFWSKRIKDTTQRLVVVAIARNEEEYIREWVAFHKVVGVDCIYLYDNESTDGMVSQIQDFIDCGFVRYTYFPGEAQQMLAYNDALKKYGKECEYMAFIDCDEFLMPSNDEKSLKEVIDDVFVQEPNAGGLVVNWVMYGSSGYDKKPVGLCIDSFTMRALNDGFETDHVKSIIKPECVKAIWHPHYPIYKKGYFGVNENLKVIPAWYNPSPAYKRIRINHYITKSKAQWMKRRSQSTADGSIPRYLEDFKKYDQNVVCDETAKRYSSQVKFYTKTCIEF